jgi:hypothetical protein
MWTAAWLRDHDEVRDVPDWYNTVINSQDGLQARPVVGGFFALLSF